MFLPGSILFSGVFMFGAISGLAGTMLIAEEKRSDASGTVRKATVWLDDHALKSSAKGTSLIYRRDKQIVWILDDKAKTFRQLKKGDLETISARSVRASEKIHKELEKLSPKQQARLQKALGNRATDFAGAVGPRRTYRKTGSNDSVGQWRCDRYSGQRDDQEDLLLWTTPSAELGLSEAQQQVLADMTKLLQGGLDELAGGYLPTAEPDAEVNEGEYRGVPVKRVKLKDGQPRTEWEIKEVRHEDLDASTFELPAGYVKKSVALP